MTEEMKAIIDNVDISADKDIIIRYLIVNLAKHFQRDLNFYLRSEEEQAKMLKHGVNYNNDGKVICLTLSEFYIDLFKYFNIESYLVQVTNTMVPLYALVVKGTNCQYLIDPLADLMPSQYGIPNKSYGILPNWDTSILQDEYPFLKSLTPEYVTYLDNKINRFSNDLETEFFLNNCCNNITRNKLRSIFGHKVYVIDSIDYKLKYISDNCINLGHVNGLVERHKMYTHLFRTLFEGPERGLIKHHLFRDYKDDGTPINCELNIIVHDNNNDNTIFYVEEKNNKGYVLRKK